MRVVMRLQSGQIMVALTLAWFLITLQVPVRAETAIMSHAQKPVSYKTPQKAPPSSEERFWQARRLLQQNRPDEAFSEIMEALRERPRNADYLIIKAKILLSRKQVQPAQEALMAAIRHAPNYRDAYRLLLNTCRYQVNTLDCNEYRQNAQRLFPEAYWTQDLTPVRNTSGDISEAWLIDNIAGIRTYLTRNPDDNDARQRLAWLLTQHSQLDEALTLYDALLASSPENTEYREGKAIIVLAKARVLVNDKQWSESMPWLQEALRLSPQNREAYRLLLTSCRHQIDTVDCAEYREKAQRLFPGTFWAKDLTPLRDTSGRLDNAWLTANIADMNDYLAKYPTDSEAIQRLAWLLMQHGEYEAALAQYETLLSSAPKNEEYPLGKARALLALHRNSELVAYLKGIEPTAAHQELLIKAYLRDKHWNQTKEAIKEALSLFPEKDWEDTFASQFPIWRHELMFRSVYTDLSGDRKSWSEQKTQYQVIFPNQARLTSGITRANRFAKEDWLYNLNTSWPTGKHLTPHLEAFFGVNNTVLPDWGFYPSISIRLPAQFIVTPGVRHMQYGPKDINSGIYILEKYLRSYRLAYAWLNNHIENTGVANTHRGSVSRYYGDNNAITVSCSLGEDLESTLRRGVLSRRTLGASISGVHYISRRIGFSYALFTQSLEDLYTRKGVELGLRYLL